MRNLLHATKPQIFLGRRRELLLILVWCSVRCSELRVIFPPVIQHGFASSNGSSLSCRRLRAGNVTDLRPREFKAPPPHKWAEDRNQPEDEAAETRLRRRRSMACEDHQDPLLQSQHSECGGHHGCLTRVRIHRLTFLCGVCVLRLPPTHMQWWVRLSDCLSVSD